VERSSRTPEPRWPAGLAAVDERRYGETRVWWARVAAAPEVA
jgi:16S rRNA (guanine966-N2)-methyltransferase